MQTLGKKVRRMNQSQTPFRGNLSDADIARLRDFVQIVAAGGITAAEGRLRKGKSAISLGLSRLEQRLGLRLCERGRSGFRLTDQGRMVHSAAIQLLGEIGRFSDFVGAAARPNELTYSEDWLRPDYIPPPPAEAPPHGAEIPTEQSGSGLASLMLPPGGGS